ncbi:MAG: hypothetical protein ACYTEK_08030 [Planctomycetota bacterium]|jgi:hypothetical protein
MFIRNRIHEFEQDICSVLTQLAYHIHPKIVERIQARNSAESDYFRELFAGKIEMGNYLFDGSACVFPGVRRYVSRQGKLFAYNFEYKAIIDDNRLPRHIWCFLANGKTYSGQNWKDTGLSEFELAHVFTHKESEIEFEKPFFSTVQDSLYPYSDFSCACNVVLLPKGTVKPTDNLKAIKAAFYKRYIDLYGESPLNGRSGFNESLVPSWYSELNWNEPPLPIGWESNIEELLKYRTERITGILNR